MRVTNNTMVHSIVRYLTRQNEAIFDRQNIIASGKKINKPSDDPLGMGRVLDYRQTIASIEQYQTNIQSGKTRLGVIEANLDLVDDLMEVVGAIAQTEIGGTTESRQLAAENLKNLYDQILDQANSKLSDNYLFSGYQTKTAPFSRDDTQATTFDQFTVTYNGDAGDMQFIAADNTTITVEADGRAIFQNAASGGINIFDAMRDLIVGLENDDIAAISTQSGLFDQGRTQIRDIRSANAPILYQLKTAEKHWELYKPRIADLLGEEEGADIAKAVVELQSLELAYQSTLATAARIIQPGLINFLK
ncbi:MAG: flagellar hook-associated protein FlgL [Desulfobacterales bacterium]|nr:flagellar hook-associated protein FlgL [Desulfobacterales bacterium]